jgi:hypothetical protein
VLLLVMASGVPSLASSLSTATPSSAPRAKDAPMARFSGPITGGDRTGKPCGASLVDPASLGYTEDEYLVSGVASDLGRSETLPLGVGATEGPPTTAEYVTRMVVRRPIDPKKFNGTVVVEWNNATSQMDLEAIWPMTHHYSTKAGYAPVALSVQKAPVDTSPVGLKFWDPGRYGDLQHPGDAYSFDILTQTVRALRAGKRAGVDVLGGGRAKTVLAGGGSQSCGRLTTYINRVQETAQMIDGFLPTVCAVTDVRDDLVPVLWVNSQSEAATVSRADGGLFKLWEVAGAAHGGWWTFN